MGIKSKGSIWIGQHFGRSSIWMCSFFHCQVYEWDRFRNTDSHTRTTFTPKLPPPHTPEGSKLKLQPPDLKIKLLIVYRGRSMTDCSYLKMDNTISNARHGEAEWWRHYWLRTTLVVTQLAFCINLQRAVIGPSAISYPDGPITACYRFM